MMSTKDNPLQRIVARNFSGVKEEDPQIVAEREMQETQMQEPQKVVETQMQEKEMQAGELIDTLGLDERESETLQQLRRDNSSGEKTGRPRGVLNGQGRRFPKERATFVVPHAITDKMKFIAMIDRKLYRTVIIEAVTQYIEKWERERKFNIDAMQSSLRMNNKENE